MIIIPFKQDSEQREKNLVGLINLFNKNEKVIMFDFKVIMAEGDGFHKTKLINDGIKEFVNDEFTIVWDVDCRVEFGQIDDCIKAMRTFNNVVLGYPYRQFIGVPSEYYKSDYKDIALNAEKSNMSPYKDSFGGICIIKNSIYKNIMENENFRGWCPEDDARVLIVEKLGYNIIRDMQRPLFHIDHPRADEQGKDADFKAGWAEFQRIYKMTTEELKSYVKRGYRDELLG